jgi:hypothetical protein
MRLVAAVRALGCSAMNEPRPLRGIPLEISVEGVTVTGTIESLYINDLTVVITSHGAGRRNGTHVPSFAMYKVNWLAEYEGHETTAITPRGQQRAESLLRELYEKPSLDNSAGSE